MDPTGDVHCTFHIICYLAKLNGWNGITFNPDYMMHSVSNELKHPSNGAEYYFCPPTDEEVNSKKTQIE